MSDQDLGDVSLGGEPKLHVVTGQGRWKSRKRGHASVADRSLVDAMTAHSTSLKRDARDDGDPADAFRYNVRRSDRARRVRVTVDAVRGVEVVLPRRAPVGAAEDAATELAPWIRRRLAELDAARSVVAARGDTVPYLGTALQLVPQPGRTRAHRRGDEVLVPAGDERGLALERWYRRTAHEEIASRLDRACEQAGLSYTRLTIRAQRTRWASCSRSGAMSFNWRLLLAPPEVLDYVVWHEVCHLQVLDHSPRFWSLLARWCPDYRERSAWLRRHGQTLVL
jgi:predicted metal-dependent hydrolase